MLDERGRPVVAGTITKGLNSDSPAYLVLTRYRFPLR
jgi:hypothetical protein